MARSSAQKQKRQNVMVRIREIDARIPAPLDSEIVKELGVSQVTLSRMRREMGYKKTPPHKGFPSKLNKEAEDWVKSNMPLSYEALAEKLEIHVETAARFMRKIGCDIGHKGKWERHSHPKGFLGGKHSEDAIQKISTASKANWADPNHKLNSAETSQIRSNNSAAYQFKVRKQARFSRSNQGKREDLGGLYFRSTWEANYARYLNFLKERKKIWRWEYEADTFWFEGIKRGCRFYTPDFKVWDSETSEPRYVEVKGWMDQKSKTKLDRMKRYYPQIKIELVTEREYRALANYAAMIPSWEYCKRSRF